MEACFFVAADICAKVLSIAKQQQLLTFTMVGLCEKAGCYETYPTAWRVF